MEQALSRRITQIGWHCWANNGPSIATALKIGFEKAGEYSTYIAWVTPSDTLTATSNESGTGR